MHARWAERRPLLISSHPAIRTIALVALRVALRAGRYGTQVMDGPGSAAVDASSAQRRSSRTFGLGGGGVGGHAWSFWTSVRAGVPCGVTRVPSEIGMGAP